MWVATQEPEARQSEKTAASLLFVQNAGGISYDREQNRLTLESVSHVTLFESRWSEGQLTWRVKLLAGEIPASGGPSSLFIDGLLVGAGRGSASGAVGGAIAGIAGKGAGVGAVLGATSSLLQRRRMRRAEELR